MKKNLVGANGWGANGKLSGNMNERNTKLI